MRKALLGTLLAGLFLAGIIIGALPAEIQVIYIPAVSNGSEVQTFMSLPTPAPTMTPYGATPQPTIIIICGPEGCEVNP